MQIFWNMPEDFCVTADAFLRMGYHCIDISPFCSVTTGIVCVFPLRALISTPLRLLCFVQGGLNLIGIRAENFKAVCRVLLWRSALTTKTSEGNQTCRRFSSTLNQDHIEPFLSHPYLASRYRMSPLLLPRI